MESKKIEQTSEYNKKETDSDKENKLVVTSRMREGGRGKVGVGYVFETGKTFDETVDKKRKGELR